MYLNLAFYRGDCGSESVEIKITIYDALMVGFDFHTARLNFKRTHTVITV
jgi:hypothetical protein